MIVRSRHRERQKLDFIPEANGGSTSRERSGSDIQGSDKVDWTRYDSNVGRGKRACRGVPCCDSGVKDGGTDIIDELVSP